MTLPNPIRTALDAAIAQAIEREVSAAVERATRPLEAKISELAQRLSEQKHSTQEALRPMAENLAPIFRGEKK